MTLNITMPEMNEELKPRITVVGVGGAGGNAVNNMIRSNLSGVEFMVANTDAQSLRLSQADCKIQLGLHLTHGLGAGSRPDVGRAAAEEAMDDIMEHLHGRHMVFITAGMGGGTGTGAAPVVARHARDAGILTVGVVTKPFHFEGTHRMRTAEEGIEELSRFVDTLIIIPNQNLFRIANERTTFAEAFHLADDVLYSGVRGVTDLMVMPGLINLDFADIRAVMSEMGKAMMGTGEAEGERRATEAAEAAISNPLLDDMSMKGARGILINITGGLDMTLFEVDEAANRIRDEVDPDANIIFGATFDETLDGMMRVSVVATGIDALPKQQEDPHRLGEGARIRLATSTEEPLPSGESEAPAAAQAAGPADPSNPPRVAIRAAAGGAAAVGNAAVAYAPPASETQAHFDTSYVAAPGADRPAPTVAPAPEPMATPWTVRPDVLQRQPQPRSHPQRQSHPQRIRDRFIAPRPAVPGGESGQRGEGEERPRRSWFGIGRPKSERQEERSQDQQGRTSVDRTASGQQEEQGGLRGVTPDDRTGVSSEQDDLLEIPAFLRRQAN